MSQDQSQSHRFNHRLKYPGAKRLMLEARELRDNTEDYWAQPIDDNLFEWHFTVRGPPDTAFDGGIYHGRISFPTDYPMKPPSIIMLTPNGRFVTNRKICLSISGHHPETWQPSWSVRTALLAIIGFMPSNGRGAIGSLNLSDEERRMLARRSRTWCCDKCGPIRELLKKPSPSSVTATTAQSQNNNLNENCLDENRILTENRLNKEEKNPNCDKLVLEIKSEREHLGSNKISQIDSKRDSKNSQDSAKSITNQNSIVEGEIEISTQEYRESSFINELDSARSENERNSTITQSEVETRLQNCQMLDLKHGNNVINSNYQNNVPIVDENQQSGQKRQKLSLESEQAEIKSSNENNQDTLQSAKILNSLEQKDVCEKKSFANNKEENRRRLVIISQSVHSQDDDKGGKKCESKVIKIVEGVKVGNSTFKTGNSNVTHDGPSPSSSKYGIENSGEHSQKGRSQRVHERQNVQEQQQQQQFEHFNDRQISAGNNNQENLNLYNNNNLDIRRNQGQIFEINWRFEFGQGHLVFGISFMLICLLMRRLYLYIMSNLS